MTILVTGGAGYIGSHVLRELVNLQRRVVALDDLSTGRRDRVVGIPLEVVDLSESASIPVIVSILEKYCIDSVIHLAAKKRVDESVARPAYYYAQNVGGLAHLVLAMTEAQVGKIVYSSSAAVYGTPSGGRAFESSALLPVNPYGQTKAIGESLLQASEAAGVLRAISLRYFNVAGAVDKSLADRELSNLIPITVHKAMTGEPAVIYGTDYDTPDGTCIRDYVHVVDLARAHVAALAALDDGASGAFNIGTGVGYSVRDVVRAVGSSFARTPSPIAVDRRSGDPGSVVADVTAAHATLGWTAQYGIDEIVQSAVAAMRTN